MKQQPWYNTPKPSFHSKHAIIIGAGLAGTASAYSLAKRGWKVTIIDRNSKAGQEASGNLAGIVNPLLSHKNDMIGEFYLAGFNYTLDYIKNLQQSGHDIDYNQCGALELGKKKVTDQTRELSVQEAGDICGIKLGIGGVFNASAGFVNPSKLYATALSACNSIKTIFSTEVLSLNKIEENWLVLDNLGSEICHAPVVIIANAGDAKKFTQCSWLPLEKVRGQITFLPDSGITTKTIISYDGGYIMPDIEGISCVGATFKRDTTNLDVSIEEHIENITNLKKHISVKDYDYTKLQGRASFRATSPDRRPIIGPIPDYAAFINDYSGLRHGKIEQYPDGKYLQGLYISTGHGSRGLTGCPIAGEILATQINNEPLPIPKNIADGISPTRFIIRSLKRTR